MKILYQNLTLKACSKETIARADDVFSYIDSDFENYGTDKKSVKTKGMEVAILEQEKDGTFKDLFDSISADTDSLVMTQAQIIEFCKSHKDKLSNDWYNFLLFKENSEFFVADVHVRSDGLGVRVRRLSGDDVWLAGYRGRFVVPQLALSPSDTLTPKTFAECPFCGNKVEICMLKVI